MSSTLIPVRRTTALVAAVMLLASALVAVLPSGAARAVPDAAPVVVDDFNDGDASDWGFFGGNAAGGGGGALDDRPYEGSHYLSTGWGGEGTDSGFYGGAFKNLPDAAQITPPVDPWFNVWVLNQSDATVDAYTLEVTIREDNAGDGWTDGVDDSFRLDTPFSSADFDDEWTQVSAPLSAFDDLATGGNGTFDGALDEVVIVIGGVQGGSGSTVEVDFDLFAFSTGGPLALSDPPAVELIDDFESGVAPGTPCAPNVPPLGFCTFSGAGSSVSIAAATTPPAPELDAVGTPNGVLQMDVDVTSFAGFIHGFESGGEWVSQDWSTREGFSLWFFGQDSGATVFIDILENRNPGSATDDAERHSVDFVDDFSGWQLLEFPFSSFSRKEIGNGAPNDGFDRFEVHGWALGTLGTGGPRTFYVDQVSVYGEAELPPVTVNLAQQNTLVEEGETAHVSVKLNRPLGPDDPEQVSIDYATERSYAVPGEEFTPTSGTLTFTRGGPSVLSFAVETFGDSRFEGDEQVVIRLTNPVDVERGSLFQGSVLIDDDDPFDPDIIDEFTQGAHLWETRGPATLERIRVADTDGRARPGQDAVEDLVSAQVPLSVDVVVEGNVCRPPRGIIPLYLLSTPDFDATTVDHTTVTLGDATEVHTDRRTGEPRRHVEDVNDDGLDDLVFHFRLADVGVPCTEDLPLDGSTVDGQPITTGGSDAALVRDFALAQDWTGTESVSFWYHGAGGGEDVVVTLKDNRAPDPGPSGWDLVWSDEFDEPAGTVPDPESWTHEIGDTTPDGKNGWGNDELQYYTDDPANAATDGDGNLVVTLAEADGSQECYYGPCEFTSARLLTQHKEEFAYGRIESRLKVPDGGAGLWPAFWSLGTDITYNPWPGAGEIDIMEYVSRLPNEIFGTVHGPGYSGGGSVGDLYDFGEPVYEAPLAGTTDTSNDGYHTFTVEWEPELITWYVDGVEYHRVTPDGVPGPWVFDKPFFLLLNFAIGGNFGGAPDAGNTYPQEYLVDYVRVYQGPDTAERYEASFTDDAVGWREVTIPIGDFVRSDAQPDGAPDDGLGLGEVWGVGLALPDGNAAGELMVDAVRRVPEPPPSELVVTTLADSGEGSLREALGLIADGGTITFDPALAGGTIPLDGGPIVIRHDVTIDASAAPDVTVDGGGTDRVLIVEPGASVSVRGVTLTNGYGWQLAGCVLNNGTLSLDQVTVRGCSTATDAGDFWQGGGGIYSGDGAVLHLVDSVVSGNHSAWDGGGVLSFLNSHTTITRSTIEANVAANVGGGLRLLGDAVVEDSRISDNSAVAWHGGALFLTDGVLEVTGTAITGNTTTDLAAIFVGTFGASSASMTIGGSTVIDNQAFGCFLAPWGSGSVAIDSLGGNVFQDDTCGLAPDDEIAIP